MNPARDDWHDLYDRIRSLMAAYGSNATTRQVCSNDRFRG
jgi:hypothetical protein